jgi:glycosyltransferase involved in cell wall biosynthesis
MISNQTFKDFELIIIDDGSTDNSCEMCMEKAKKDSRIKVISKENGGTWAARNRGIDESIGKYIIFFDCDDFYDDDLLRSMYQCIDDRGVDLVISGQINVTVNAAFETIRTAKVLPQKQFFKTKNEILEKYISLRKQEIGDTLWNKIYKSEIIKKNNLKFEQYKRGEDCIFNANYYEAIETCIVLNKAFYSYIIENANPVWLKYSENYLNIVLEENNAIVNKLESWGKNNSDAVQYQSTHFTYRITEYFFGVVYSKELNFKNKCESVSNIISDENVQNNLKNSNVNGKFNKMVIKLMKSKKIVLILILVKIKLIYNNIKDRRYLK